MVAEHRPTLEMVAERAGVGRGTVSRVINGSGQVRPETREAVLAAIEELGYSPNHAARSLVTRRTDTIAMVVSETGDRLFAQPFFADIVRGVSSTLNERGQQLMLTMARSEGEHKRLSDYLTGRHVDGVLVVSLHQNDPLPARLAEAGVPVVYGGRPPEVVGARGEPSVHYVDIDNVGGAYAATRRLVDTGRRRVATVSGPQDMVAGLDRLAGFRQALRDAGLPDARERTATGDFTHEGGERAMAELLATAPDLDGVFVASDLMALGAMRVLREAGRRVPDDVAVIGFDDSELALHSEPLLTTVHQPSEQMGAEMARVLLEIAIPGGQEAGIRILDTHLVVRDSG